MFIRLLWGEAGNATDGFGGLYTVYLPFTFHFEHLSREGKVDL